MWASLCVTLVCVVPQVSFLEPVWMAWCSIRMHRSTLSRGLRLLLPHSIHLRIQTWEWHHGHFSTFQLQRWKTRWQPLWKWFSSLSFPNINNFWTNIWSLCNVQNVHCLHSGSHLWKQWGISDISSRKSDLRGCSSRNFQLGTRKFPLLVAATIERPSHVKQ